MTDTDRDPALAPPRRRGGYLASWGGGMLGAVLTAAAVAAAGGIVEGEGPLAMWFGIGLAAMPGAAFGAGLALHLRRHSRAGSTAGAVLVVALPFAVPPQWLWLPYWLLVAPLVARGLVNAVARWDDRPRRRPENYGGVL